MKLIKLVYLFLPLALLGCEADEEHSAATLSIEVRCDSFEGATAGKTRIPVEEGYKTVFKGGEQIGITAVKGGVIYHGMDNVPFTYDATAGAWNPSNTSLPQLYYYPDVTFIAYYPYDAAMSGKKSEQEIIDAFTPQTDQSTYAAYTASDLMTGEGTVSVTSEGLRTLTFQLKHQMALLVLCPDFYANCVAPPDAGYEYYTGARCKWPVQNAKINNTVGCDMGDDTYRVIVKPDTTDVSLEYTLAGATTSYTSVSRTIAIGTYYQFKLGHPSITGQRTVQIGDFYYSDGKLMPGVDGVEPVRRDDCIGIVFHTGPGTGDSIANYSTENMTGPDIHGYVVALKDAYASDTDKKWGPRSQFFSNEETTQFNGYVKRSYADNGDWRCLAAAEIRNFRIAVPTPAMATNWYLPSLAELQAIWNVYKHSAGNPVYDSLQKSGGELFAGNLYWSVTEISYHDVYLLNMQTGGGGTSGKCSGNDMGWGWDAYSGIHLTRVIFTF